MWSEFFPLAATTLSFLATYLPERSALLSNALLILGAWLVTKGVQRSYLTSLWRIPGPLLNSFTNIPLNIYIACGKYHWYTEKLHSKYGLVVRVGYNQVSVSDASELKRILSTHDFPKGSFYKTMRTLPPTIFSTTDSNLNKTRRRQLGNSYSLPFVRLYEDKILNHGVLSLISLWNSQIVLSPNQDKTMVNFYYSFHGMAFDIIGVLGFGKSFDIVSTGNTRMIDCVAKTIKLGAIRSSAPFGKQVERLFPSWISDREYIRATAISTIKKRKQENVNSGMNGNGINRVDVLQRLVSARDPFTGKPIDDISLVAEVLLLLLAGTDTTSNTLTWVILCLLHRPDIYNRLRKEIRGAFPDKNTVITFDLAKNKLTYLTAVIYEVMRLHPAVSGYLPRSVPEQGTHLMDGKYFLPKGTEICVSLYAYHRNTELWRNPSDFDPERFMGPDSEARIKDILVFSSGVRICVGRHLAMAELYTTLANLILRYDFKLPDGKACQNSSVGNTPGKSFFSYKPKNPDNDCWMVVTPAKTTS